MRLLEVGLRDFKRFTDIEITDLPKTARLIVLAGPNGSGKSSLFEAFNFWMSYIRKKNHADSSYYPKSGSTKSGDPIASVRESIHLKFHDVDYAVHAKTFYMRSAYRHQASFTIDTLERSDDILQDSKRPRTMIERESRVSDNYGRMIEESIKALFDPAMSTKSLGEVSGRLIGAVRDSMARLFDGLILTGPGLPMFGGTFFFDKGASKGFEYKNLSGGEKAAFDLILDMIVKSEVFDDTIYCIDEPDLHMHTRLQGELLSELMRLLPEKCQLWISTHSIGMTRRAMEMHRESPDEVVFLDFGGHDFDKSVDMKPAQVNREFWKRMFAVALDDLADLVAPDQIVCCEGRAITLSSGQKGGFRQTTFDAEVYKTIFSGTHPGTDFIPLGGKSSVERDGKIIATVFETVAPAVKTRRLLDRDDRSDTEISKLRSEGVSVLRHRDLENFLWSDEILAKLATLRGQPEAGLLLQAERERLLRLGTANQLMPDDVKAASGKLYNFTKQTLSISQAGNNAESFARDTLAPLVTPDTATYRELAQDIFGNPT